MPVQLEMFPAKVDSRRSNNPEEFIKNKILTDLQHRNIESLIEKRKVARKFVYDNAHEDYSYCVSSDDVNRILGVSISRTCKKNNVNGTIFRGNGWTFVRMIPSQRKGSHARKICLYTVPEFANIAGEKKNVSKE